MDRATTRPVNIFTGLALDRMAERRDDRDWLATLECAPQSRFLVLDPDIRLLSDAAMQAPRLLTPAERADLLPDDNACLLGVADDGRNYFLLRADAERAEAAARSLQAERIGLRHAGTQFDAFAAGLSAYACGLAHWQSRTRFCPACGGPLEHISAGHRARCTQCGGLQFPRSDPAIIVIVEHDGACLLGRQARWPQARYSTLAGFVEPGESLEDAVRREVAEETGVTVDTCQYHSSQPWPFPASLMLGFTAQARSRDDIVLRDRELEHAAWFTPDEIVRDMHRGHLKPPTRLSVSWQLIAHWLHARAGIDLDELDPTSPAT